MVSLIATLAFGIAAVSGIETPKYTVESTRDGYEIRQYETQVLAQVVVEGKFEKAVNQGFRKIADYIFGNNTSRSSGDPGKSQEIEMTAPVLSQEVQSEKIKMTAPVVEQEQSEGRHMVAFVMPSEHHLDSLPTPNNPDVKLTEIPARRYAVLSFSGVVTAEVVKERKSELLQKLAQDSLNPAGEPIVAQYDPPWTPPAQRRNEILIELPAGSTSVSSNHPAGVEGVSRGNNS